LATSALLTAAAAGTTWVSMWSWGRLVAVSGGFLNPLLLLAIVIAGVGVATRWWRWPGGLVLLSQIVVSGMVASLLLCGSPLPYGSAWTELHQTFSDAVTTSKAYAAPVPDGPPPVDPLLIAGGLACLLLVDLFACTLRRAALAGIPLLAVFSVPVSMVGESVTWWIFALGTAGYLLLMFLQESDQVSRWGRPIGVDRETGDPIAFGAGSHTVRATAGLIGGAATALALALPAALPVAGFHVFDVGPGHGGGDDIHVVNPTINLVRDLKRGDDVPLLQVTTTDPDPSYLRILTLARFNDAEWSPGDRDVPADHLADGAMPPPEGVAAQTRRRSDSYEVTALPAFDSRWLPTQPPISRINATGDWRYDDKTMDFLAGDDDLNTAGLSYTMTAVHLDITSQQLAEAGPSTHRVDDIFTDLPDDLPPLVADLAAEVTQDATTPYEKAVALQDWFRNTGGFTYSLDRQEGNGTEALVEFLSPGPGGRVGYCEQFAASMAAMARTLGIPARVAVGFLTPSADGARTWIYSAHDMHAWPELYFEGSGWVRFEPTPAGRATDVPAYTVPRAGDEIEPTKSPSTSVSQSVEARPTAPRDTGDLGAAANDDADAGSGLAWVQPLAVVLGLLLLVGLLLLPRLLRLRRRERRLRSRNPELIWDELRDTAIDLAIPWPEGRSPRVTREVLVDHLGLPVDGGTVDRPAHGPTIAPAAASALDRLVQTLELHRYARSGATVDPLRLRADAEACLDSLTGGAPRGARRRAAWLPRSVVRLGRRQRVVNAPVEARYGMVDRVG
jgi:transglutaminase-like putative cysteine protease